MTNNKFKKNTLMFTGLIISSIFVGTVLFLYQKTMPNKNEKLVVITRADILQEIQTRKNLNN